MTSAVQSSSHAGVVPQSNLLSMIVEPPSSRIRPFINAAVVIMDEASLVSTVGFWTLDVLICQYSFGVPK